jgi:hypothetical protein
MEKPDQLRELFRMQKALNERIGVHADGLSEVNFQRQDSGYTSKDHDDSKHI